MTTRSLVDWPPGQALDDSGVVRARHHLHDTGLFDDQRLLALFDEIHPDELLVYRMGGDHRRLGDFQLGSRGGLSAAELLAAVQDGKLWLNLLNVDEHAHAGLGELVDALYGELERKAPGFRVVWRSANLLVSSPAAKVYYHADGPANLLWHLRGRKRVWVYPRDERFAPREWIERIFTRESDDDLPYCPDFDAHARAYELGPGEVIAWPHNSPHRVDNLEGLNLSLTSEHYTPAGDRKRLTYMSNRYFRSRLGLPMTDVTLDGTLPSAKRMLYRVARRLPGLGDASAAVDEPKFTLRG